MNESLFAGIDIGGSHITVALINAHNLEIVDRSWRRFSINSGADAATIIAEWAQAIKESFGACSLEPGSLGIAMPGPFDYEAGISLMQHQNKYDALYGLNVKSLLAEALSISPSNIKMTNDAACYLQGEIINGVAKGKRKVLGITLGTGLGSAWTKNETVADADLWRAPFGEGMAEDYLSNRWFLKRYTELTSKSVNGVKELSELAPAMAEAQQVFDEFGENLGAFIVQYTQHDPVEMVVLGGNIASAFSLFSTSLERVLQEKKGHIEVRPTVLGENAILLGAASYCFETSEVEMHTAK